MELKDVLNSVLYTVLTVILPVVATYLVNLIKIKIAESNVIAEATKNEEMTKLIKNALDDVMDAVLYVNQTYVDSLKKSGSFTEESQKEAFDRAYNEAMNLISEGSKKAIQEVYGSFDDWLKLKIEASVSAAKK